MKHVDSIHENEDTHNCCRICDGSFFHKHFEKVQEIGATIQKSKSLSCNKSCSKKGELNNHTINRFIEFNYHPSVSIVIKVFHKNVNL